MRLSRRAQQALFHLPGNEEARCRSAGARHWTPCSRSAARPWARMAVSSTSAGSTRTPEEGLPEAMPIRQAAQRAGRRPAPAGEALRALKHQWPASSISAMPRKSGAAAAPSALQCTNPLFIQSVAAAIDRMHGAEHQRQGAPTHRCALGGGGACGRALRGHVRVQRRPPNRR